MTKEDVLGTCSHCKKKIRKEKLLHVPSIGTLICYNLKRGPQYVYRCIPCERKVAVGIVKTIRQIGKL